MSEALRLAELIDNDLKNSAHHVEAAAELRRLHAECDALRTELATLRAQNYETQSLLAGAEAEREACAQVAENGMLGLTIAKAIRARGEK